MTSGSIAVELACYEKREGILRRTAELELQTYDAPLGDIILKKVTPLQNGKQDKHTIQCFAGNFQGLSIDLRQTPHQIEYICDAVKNDSKPVLFVIKDFDMVPHRHRDEQVDINGQHCSDDDREEGSEEEEEEEEEGYDDLLEGTAGDIIAEFLRNGFPTNTLQKGVSWCEDPLAMPSSSSPSKASQSQREAPFFELITYDTEPSSTPSRRPLGRSITTAASTDMGTGGEEQKAREDAAFSLLPTSPAPSQVACPSQSNGGAGAGSKGSCVRKTSYFLKERKSKTLFLRSSDEGKPAAGGEGQRHHRVSHISSPMTSTYVSGSVTWKRKSGIRRKRKISTVIPVIPEVSYTLEVTSITAETEKGVILKVPCKEYSTIGDIKEAITKQLNQESVDGSAVYWKTSDIILLYTLEGKQYELFSEWQFFFMTELYQSWVRSGGGGQTTPIQVRSAHRGSEKDLPVLFRLSRLAGMVMDPRLKVLSEADLSDMVEVAAADMREVQWARKMLHSFIDQTVQTRDAEDYALSVEVETGATSTVLALKIPLDNKVDVTFHYKQHLIATKRIGVHEYPDSILKDVFPSLVSSGIIKESINNHTLQVCGEKSYIAGKHEFIEFRDIRRCIVKGEPIHLSVTEKPSQDMDRPSQLSWCPVDPLSRVTPLHLDIAKKASPTDAKEAVSVWDREDELNLRIITVDNLPPVPSKHKSTLTIQATLYHGGKRLSDTVLSAATHSDTSIRWKETLNFRKAKKDIPKAAKVMVVLHETVGRKDSGKKSPHLLYWGLINVFDYQGMLQNGEKTMSLWKGTVADSRKTSSGSHGSTEEAELFGLNPSGPATNNPDPKAISVTIRFESYTFPILYPSCSPQSRASLLQSSKADAFIQKHFQKVLDQINQGSLHSAVPTYIAKANWGTLHGSLEVYSLLDRLMEAKDSFPIATALRLLDCDFPDENVRTYATTVLERIPDEQLEDFLLQLTQALKFELNHDSALARFLLKRALNNKRIGHFFFWYLKCEMFNPQYRNRFSVVLEAYLRGCGEDMLVKFEHQVELQTRLEAIGRTLKQLCNDDHGKMQLMLPELLEANRLTNFVITAVYNPRIQLGNLCPTKCKIMASKKKPQWLEMSNVDPTALVHTPTRLILKLGDDLRQDMITLRMFSLFEKFWEEDGLDLELIPYGCIATGPNTGYIEVVKNAKTIAEVSGVSNNTKLYDWIRSHQKNELGEIDEIKVRVAIRKFIHSCAGYSVATYVLGIGDRHNDNVMVTTSGNLFHIDFGHFLGNIKYCMGFKREWAPFVLTPDFVYVMGGEESDTFEMYKNLCCRAFLTLRRHSDIIINLFSMMRSTGIPELTCVEDTDYIKKALLLHRSEPQAEEVFRGIIKKCLDLKWTVQVMWKIHLLRKRGSS